MYTFKNIYFYYYLILMVSACSKGYSLSLEEALTSSLETNLEIKIEESNLAASEENVTQSISNYFPSITFLIDKRYTSLFLINSICASCPLGKKTFALARISLI